jgi:FdhD protein
LPLVTNVRTLRIDLNERLERRVGEDVAIEAPVTVRVNGQTFVTLIASPFEQKELAIGHLLGEGIIETLSEVNDVRVEEGQVDVTISRDISKRLELANRVKIVTTACGSVEDFYRLLDSVEKPYVKSEYKIPAEKILRMVHELNIRSLRNRAEVAIHSAVLFCNDELVAYTEDAGRHNSVDKLIGIAALKDTNFDHSVMLTTGRQASDMVIKAARAGIPIAVTMRGPLYSGIFAAWRTGVTALAFARGARMAIYTYPERIITPRLRVETVKPTNGTMSTF